MGNGVNGWDWGLPPWFGWFNGVGYGVQNCLGPGPVRAWVLRHQSRVPLPPSPRAARQVPPGLRPQVPISCTGLGFNEKPLMVEATLTVNQCDMNLAGVLRVPCPVGAAECSISTLGT